MLAREPEEFWIWDEQNEIYINMAEGSTETMDKDFNPIDEDEEETYRPKPPQLPSKPQPQQPQTREQKLAAELVRPAWAAVSLRSV